MRRRLATLFALLVLGLSGGRAVLGSDDAPMASETPKVLRDYGIEGQLQPIGLHHGFHVRKVAKASRAQHDELKVGDVIIRVNDSPIRSLAHLVEEFRDEQDRDGEVTLTVMREGSLKHHLRTAHVRELDRDGDEEDEPRRAASKDRDRRDVRRD